MPSPTQSGRYARRERNDERPEREREPRVDRHRHDVNRDEAADEEPAEAMNVLDREARPASERFFAAIVRPSTTTPLSEKVRGDPGGARRVPVDRARGQMHAAAR